MTRKEEISAANPYGGSSEIAYGKKIGFVIGAEWADAHPKRADDECKFCRGEEVVVSNVKHIDCTKFGYDDHALYVDIDTDEGGLYELSINYCPMCGRKLSE